MCNAVDQEKAMKLYVYADESCAFDKEHNDLFVYGGVIAVGHECLEKTSRKYAAIERDIRDNSNDFDEDCELKACYLSMRQRHRLFRAISSCGCLQFGVIVDQTKVYDRIYDNKRHKQQFLDYALKRGIKNGISDLIETGGVEKSDIDKISVCVDEHSAATSGKYSLEESIDEELRSGMYSPDCGVYHDPLFSGSFPRVPVKYLDSSKVTMVRAADITANWLYCAVRDYEKCPGPADDIEERMTILRLP